MSGGVRLLFRETSIFFPASPGGLRATHTITICRNCEISNVCDIVGGKRRRRPKEGGEEENPTVLDGTIAGTPKEVLHLQT